MENPYDKLRDRFHLFSDNMIYAMVKEDLNINGYIGNREYENMTLGLLDTYEKTGFMSWKMKNVLINYLIH